jgi:hypothetical protein
MHRTGQSFVRVHDSLIPLRSLLPLGLALVLPCSQALLDLDRQEKSAAVAEWKAAKQAREDARAAKIQRAKEEKERALREKQEDERVSGAGGARDEWRSAWCCDAMSSSNWSVLVT